MALTTLKEDLISEFREERDMVYEQMELLDPLGTSLRKPAAQRLLNNTILVIVEYGCYALFLGGLYFMFKASDVYPFSVLSSIYHTSVLPAGLKVPDVNNFVWASYGIIFLFVALLLVIGRMARVIRLKNTILHQAGKDIKTILGQHLERKAAIDAIQQRHYFDIPGITIPLSTKVKVHEVLNPGYDSDEEEEEE